LRVRHHRKLYSKRRKTTPKTMNRNRKTWSSED
jgi:hypothetical protein